MDVDDVVVAVVVVPHRVEELAAGEHLPGADDHAVEQVELDPRQLHRGTVELDFSSFAERVGSGAGYRIERFSDVRLHGSLKQQTASLLVAHQHLQDGTFGICETCGKQIPVGRLEVIPWAATCVGCA